MFVPEIQEILESSMRRINRWRVPPHYSGRDWREEIKSTCVAAVCEGLDRFNPEFGVPLGAYLRQHILACALSRCRKEWAYAIRCIAEDVLPDRIIFLPGNDSSNYVLSQALNQLSELDRLIIIKIFWEGKTLTEIAKTLNISHQAVSKRKIAVLKKLRTWLEH